MLREVASHVLSFAVSLRDDERASIDMDLANMSRHWEGRAKIDATDAEMRWIGNGVEHLLQRLLLEGGSGVRRDMRDMRDMPNYIGLILYRILLERPMNSA